MSSGRSWKILCWNVRGLNATKKWNSIRDKIIDSRCDIICLQETKKQEFDYLFIKKICPASFNKFEFVPSNGASGGMLVAWKDSLFDGELVFHNSFAMSLEFTSRVNNAPGS
ncbi:hypothetical protein BS78_K020200 [Paspalum vaginatum]|uniref:Endonuclease/exonuclease/phosphatase domain-containing protein n=1 Tax=Paspalum vaginatum TaxID=158149 RepID=A0A9W7XAJ9_9POAL|nr:hypothetical protein BS78_K228200 [Paspalum vaginatum]KAJ1256453.1 hypothetical protein BS78_K020200 [Paspalum vaginatum]